MKKRIIVFTLVCLTCDTFDNNEVSLRIIFLLKISFEEAEKKVFFSFDFDEYQIQA